MMIPKLLISLCIAGAFILPLRADDATHLDDMVASGIVFKLVCLFGAEGTWSTMETANPRSFKVAISAISKDLDLFSETKQGRALKMDGQTLISFLSRAVLLTSEPPKAGAPDAEAEKFLRDLGLDTKSADPAELAAIISERIAEYARQSNTPSWVYDRSKREQGGAGQPATRSESDSEGGDKLQPESEGRSR